MKKYIALTAAVVIVLPLLLPAFSYALEDTSDPPEFYGALTVISASNNWISDDPEQREWVVEEAGKEEQVYVVDLPALPQISHEETIQTEEITHVENIYATRVRFDISYISMEMGVRERHNEVYYDLTDIELRAMQTNPAYYDFSYTTTNESYVTGTRVVVDQEARNETVTVIDQEAREEQGHYETVVRGGKGYYRNLKEIAPGEGDGHFEMKTRMKKEELPQ